MSTPLCTNRDCENRATRQHDLCAYHAKKELAAINRGIRRRAKKPARSESETT
jgi:hypothetical protein